MFLDREPESEAVLSEHLKNDDFDSLVRVFANGPEFRQRIHPDAVRERGGQWPDDRVRMDAPAPVVEARADAATLQAFVARTRNAWLQLGQERPHHSVLTVAQFEPQCIAEHIDEFEQYGRVDVTTALGQLRRHGIMDTSQLICVEFGCGVGRMTVPLAAAFAEVVAYDISSAHLAHAAQRLRNVGIVNVRLVDCGNDVLQPIAPCDVYYSAIVLQHNPPPVIRVLIGNALAALRPGGIALFQVPTHITDYEYRNDLYLARTQPPKMEMHCLPQAEVFAVVREHGCEALEVREDLWTGRTDMFVSNTFVVRRPR